MSSAKFDALAAKVRSERLAGWITTHVAKVKARAEATRAEHAAGKAAAKKSAAKKRTAREVMKAGNR